MSGAATISRKLRGEGTASAKRVKRAVAQYARVLLNERAQTDLAFHHTAFAELILASEECEAAFGELVEEQRAALAASMLESGNTQFQTEYHTVYSIEHGRRPVVTDSKLLPSHLWSTPAPKPDLNMIRRALKTGDVPGVQWSNGGPPSVGFRARGK